jgi:4-amino-4-deoxy-L-arabinose transferase-like glycosyltransferase
VTRRPLPPALLVALAAILLVGAALRLARPGADLPRDVEGTHAALLDAFWYMEAGAGPAEGSQPEAVPGYDPPVWRSLTRVWFTVAGSSLGSAQALGALVSLACLLLTWRLVHAHLGPRAGLAAAAVMATLYPTTMLGRTTLIYGPATLALLVAAALWLGGRERCRTQRVAGEALGLALALGTVLAVRPPALCLVGGLGLLALSRYPRLRWPAALAAGLGLVAWAAVLADPELLPKLLAPAIDAGGVWKQNAYRVLRKLEKGIGPLELLQRAAVWGTLPQAGGTPGFVSLAPAACAVAWLGAVLAWLDRRRLTRAQREGLLLFFGWGGAFAGGSLFLGEWSRPGRYTVLLAPPVAAFAGYAVERWFRPPAPTLAGPGVAGDGAPPSPRRSAIDRFEASTALVFALAGGSAWAHGLTLLRPVPPSRVLATALDGVLITLAAGAVVLVWSSKAPARPRRPRADLGLALAMIAAGPGLARSTVAVASATTHAIDAKEQAAPLFGPEQRWAGPYASFLAFGEGAQRIRAPWIDTRTLNRTIASLDGSGITHVAVDAAQAGSAKLEERLAAAGRPLERVATLQPRGPRGVPLWVFTWTPAPHKER